MAKSKAGYVDGFVLPVPKRNIEKYRKMAQQGAKVWMRHGALQYFECVAEDNKTEFGLSFPQGVQAKPGETIVFAFITYKSRAHRDKVNAKVMKDPDLMAGMDMKKMPFDVARMLYGGFKTLVVA